MRRKMQVSPNMRRETDIENRIVATRRAFRSNGDLTSNDVYKVLATVDSARQAGRSDLALPVLKELIKRGCGTKQDNILRLALVHRDLQDLCAADNILLRTVRSDGADPRLLFLLAQTRFERGLPSVDLFRSATEAWPDNSEIHRNLALSLADENGIGAAIEYLENRLASHPQWIEGRETHAALQWAYGNRETFSDIFDRALSDGINLADLWRPWFSLLVQANAWEFAAELLCRVEGAQGQTPSLLASKFILAAESGTTQEAEQLFASTLRITGDAISTARIRYLLKMARFEEAHNLVVPLLQGSSSTSFWPYASLIWRLLGDPRAQWLDRCTQLIRVFDDVIARKELQELSAVLKSMHARGVQYLEQSVKGGTQTDRSILFNADPVIQRIRRKWLRVLNRYVDELPPNEALHPMLGTPRNDLRIEGSWSVRLSPGGRNVPHTHPRGWVSSVLYVEVPDPSDTMQDGEGDIAFGVPPAELNQSLSATHRVSPMPGQVVVFPSNTWHSTVPMLNGHRTVIALDLKPPLF